MEKPEMELVSFDMEDIIVTSGCPTNCYDVGADKCSTEVWEQPEPQPQ